MTIIFHFTLMTIIQFSILGGRCIGFYGKRFILASRISEEIGIFGLIQSTFIELSRQYL